MSLINRLWNMSPKQLTHAVHKRVRLDRSADTPKPAWHRIAAGPLSGSELFLAVEEDPSWRAMVAGTHDQFLFDAAATLGPLDGKVIWDVGTHIGFHSMSFAALVGATGRVVSFEPNPFNLERIDLHLKRNTDLASRIMVKRVALSDSTGTAEFRFSDDVEHTYSSGGHLTTADAPCEEDVYGAFGLTKVQTATIDELVASGEVPAPDVMKLDVEGAEGAVLRGGRNVIPSKRPLILVEVHHILQMLEVSQLLLGWGYRMEVINLEDASAGRCFVLARPDAR